MTAFVKVDKQMVKKLQEELQKFKIKIQQGTRFDNFTVEEELVSLTMKNIATPMTGHSNHKEVYHPRKQGLIRKYQIRLVQMVLIIISINTLTVLNFLNGKNFINQLFRKALKVHTTDQIQPQLALGQTAFVEVALKNDTTLIENMAPSLVVANSISVLADIRNNELPSLENHDPIIEDVLEGNACKYTSGLYADYCERVRKGAKNFGLIQMITSYEMLMTKVNEQYHSSQVKSKEYLQGLLSQAFSSSVTSMSFLKLFTTIIANAVNQDFEDYYQINMNRFNSLNTMYLIVLIIICLTIHFLLVNRLKESENQFKKVLQTLPPDIILNNAFVKAYLRKTSHALFKSAASN